MRIAILGPAAPKELCAHYGLNVGTEGPPAGLGGTPINSLINALLSDGHSVTLITTSPDISERWSTHNSALEIVVVPQRARARKRALDFFAMERREMAKALSEREVDVVHAHWAYEFGWVGVTSGRPALLTVHDAPFTILKHMPNLYRLVRLAMAFRVRAKASRVTAVSPYLALQWRKQLQFRKQVEVIPNITPELPRAGRPAGHLLLVEVADASRRKNVRMLLRAFQIVRRHTPDAELRLIGGGLDTHSEMAQWARQNDLTGGVKLVGFQTRLEIAKHLSEATIFCHAALEESQPMCLLEAMTIGVPIIAGRTSGGVAWTLDGGDAGELVDVSSAESIASAIMYLGDNPAARNRYVDKGKRLVATRYSAKTISKAYLEEYEKCIHASEAASSG